MMCCVPIAVLKRVSPGVWMSLDFLTGVLSSVPEADDQRITSHLVSMACQATIPAVGRRAVTSFFQRPV